MIEMELLGVQVEMPSRSHLLLLREVSGEGRVLPLVIDTPEAQAIYRGVEKILVPRPLTHDLMIVLIDLLGAELKQVTVTAIQDRTFFAEMEIAVGDETHHVSARPSDAIAMAVRVEAPIFASEEVMTAAGQVIEIHTFDGDDVDPDELLDEFKQFLADVDPDDFSTPEVEPESDTESESKSCDNDSED